MLLMCFALIIEPIQTLKQHDMYTSESMKLWLLYQVHYRQIIQSSL